MACVLNQQRKIRIDPKNFEEFTINAVESIEEARGNSVVVAFVSDRKMKELNHFFRGKLQTTDVLSFPFETDGYDEADDYLGDIVISLEQAERQAKENKLKLDVEVKQLILHGILHLCGYDHETDKGQMNRLELKLRDKLGIG